MTTSATRPQAHLVVDGRALAAFAGLLADPTRATMCLALFDGRAWTLAELAAQAGVAASTASEHVSRLVAAGVLREERRGRHRHVRLADARTAGLIEALALRAGAGPVPRSLSAVRASEALRAGRTCYDHLAGRLGVTLTDALVARGLATDAAPDGGLALTAGGLAWLTSLGVDVPALLAARRPLVRDCVDWTERRRHLAGGAAAALLDVAFDRGWIERLPSSRAVRLTRAGRDALAADLGPALDTV